MCVLGLILCPMTQPLTLREAREQRRKPLTQVQLAERAEVDQTYVSLIERGLRTPSDEISDWPRRWESPRPAFDSLNLSRRQL
jgi:DNA-binding XRE family transcriptional regulator